jgi:transposase
MLGVTLTACGLVTATSGTWRGYANARHALVSLARDGDPTREAIEASRPVLARTRVRRFVRFVRPVVAAMLWLAIAMYGLLMVSLGGTVA